MSTTQLATTASVGAAVANQAAVRGHPYFQAYLPSNQSVTAGMATRVQFGKKVLDSGNVL
jgi:PPE-repeat protein